MPPCSGYERTLVDYPSGFSLLTLANQSADRSNFIGCPQRDKWREGSAVDENGGRRIFQA